MRYLLAFLAIFLAGFLFFRSGGLKPALAGCDCGYYPCKQGNGIWGECRPMGNDVVDCTCGNPNITSCVGVLCICTDGPSARGQCGGQTCSPAVGLCSKSSSCIDHMCGCCNGSWGSCNQGSSACTACNDNKNPQACCGDSNRIGCTWDSYNLRCTGTSQSYQCFQGGTCEGGFDTASCPTGNGCQWTAYTPSNDAGKYCATTCNGNCTDSCGDSHTCNIPCGFNVTGSTPANQSTSVSTSTTLSWTWTTGYTPSLVALYFWDRGTPNGTDVPTDPGCGAGLYCAIFIVSGTSVSISQFHVYSATNQDLGPYPTPLQASHQYIWRVVPDSSNRPGMCSFTTVPAPPPSCYISSILPTNDPIISGAQTAVTAHVNVSNTVSSSISWTITQTTTPGVITLDPTTTASTSSLPFDTSTFATGGNTGNATITATATVTGPGGAQSTCTASTPIVVTANTANTFFQTFAGDVVFKQILTNYHLPAGKYISNK